jgi:phenylacetyl-CoA:acceptor oxidoreductase subunit 2
VKADALEPAGKALVWIGSVAALALVFVVPPLAGLAALAAGGWLKFALVTRASFNQGFSLPHLPVRGAR